jgi:hypothetical protein
VFSARYELNSYIVFRKRLVSKRFTCSSVLKVQAMLSSGAALGFHLTAGHHTAAGSVARLPPDCRPSYRSRLGCQVQIQRILLLQPSVRTLLLQSIFLGLPVIAPVFLRCAYQIYEIGRIRGVKH